MYNRRMEKDTLSTEQRNVLLGLLLGDGSLEFDGYHGTRLQIKQAEARKEYVFWLYEHFAPITKTQPKQRTDTQQWYFGTRYRADLEKIRQLFYQGGKKVLPESIASLLVAPVSIAVWYMDDGHLDYRAKSHYAYRLSTDSFTQEEVVQLQAVLYERFGIRSTLHMSLCRGKRYPQIYIGKDGRDAFYNVVAPFILPCFRYKLPPFFVDIDPSETTRRAPSPLQRAGDDIVRSS